MDVMWMWMWWGKKGWFWTWLVSCSASQAVCNRNEWSLALLACRNGAESTVHHKRETANGAASSANSGELNSGTGCSPSKLGLGNLRDEVLPLHGCSVSDMKMNVGWPREGGTDRRSYTVCGCGAGRGEVRCVAWCRG